MIDHVSVGVANLEEAADFYGPVLETLGAKELARLEGLVAYGRDRVEYLIMKPYDGGEASSGNGAHFAFAAETEAAVERFHAAAIAGGGVCEGEPGVRQYPHQPVYAAYVRDPFGNKLEALTAGFAA